MVAEAQHGEVPEAKVTEQSLHLACRVRLRLSEVGESTVEINGSILHRTDNRDVRDTGEIVRTQDLLSVLLLVETIPS